uniref:ATP synthase F0 subunit 8 n=1 Tax=Ochthebius lejolisii TaxID=1309210 RepID=UPI002E7A456A|nr:ATP synthase F0 subunit 8 [Ochthebius lejolisii]WPM98410.1 ATP synthase F0 subunit 8 [Ochthebius lejolisii]
MPQMAPMNWLMLFMLFITIFMMYSSLNYFSFLYLFNNSYKPMISKNKLNWKW